MSRGWAMHLGQAISFCGGLLLASYRAIPLPWRGGTLAAAKESEAE